MTTEILIIPVMTAIATAILFLLQMAMLNASLSASFGKDGPDLEEWKDTYMRIIIKREALSRLT